MSLVVITNLTFKLKNSEKFSWLTEKIMLLFNLETRQFHRVYSFHFILVEQLPHISLQDFIRLRSMEGETETERQRQRAGRGKISQIAALEGERESLPMLNFFQKPLF